MPSTLNSEAHPEDAVIDALIERLEQVCDSVYLGYSISGAGNDLKPPAILVQLESMPEQTRSNQRAKFTMQFIISSVAYTESRTTYELIKMVRSIRNALHECPLCPQARSITTADVQFDIAPSNGQLSFADMSVNIEVVL